MGVSSTSFPSPLTVTSWAQILERLESFPAPNLAFDDEGDLAETAWIFRGVRDAEFKLEPSIERSADMAHEWAALEVSVSAEFKARAHNFLSTPASDDELGWLALMQHYEVPTRLLDFTFSPFVALFFAVRNTSHKSPKPSRIWAINAQAVKRKFLEIYGKASNAARIRREGDHGQTAYVSFHPDDSSSRAEVLRSSIAEMQRYAGPVLAATGTVRSELNRLGCISVGYPSVLNPRLSNQQGLFLFNGAEELTFEASLTKMMASETDWYRSFDIAEHAFSEIERRLYQMNIHEQSLFPDLYGLAGLIKQRIRLHWQSNDRLS